MALGKIIFLNGVSSAGKTSLTKELQSILDEPYFHISFDTFFFMMPNKYYEDKVVNDYMQKALHNSIITFSNLNINVIVDHVLYKKPMLLDCLKLLKDYPILFVGVHCPLEELERREKDRGNRPIGKAKRQLNYFHKNEIYDIEVNTFNSTLNECALMIKEKLDKNEFSKSFLEMHDKYKDEIN